MGAEDKNQNAEAGKEKLKEEAPLFQQFGGGGGGGGEESRREQVLLLPDEVVRKHDRVRGSRLPHRVVPLRVRGHHSRAQGQMVLQGVQEEAG